MRIQEVPVWAQPSQSNGISLPTPPNFQNFIGGTPREQYIRTDFNAHVNNIVLLSTRSAGKDIVFGPFDSKSHRNCYHHARHSHSHRHTYWRPFPAEVVKKQKGYRRRYLQDKAFAEIKPSATSSLGRIAQSNFSG